MQTYLKSTWCISTSLAQCNETFLFLYVYKKIQVPHKNICRWVKKAVYVIEVFGRADWVNIWPLIWAAIQSKILAQFCQYPLNQKQSALWILNRFGDSSCSNFLTALIWPILENGCPVPAWKCYLNKQSWRNILRLRLRSLCSSKQYRIGIGW